MSGCNGWRDWPAKSCGRPVSRELAVETTTLLSVKPRIPIPLTLLVALIESSAQTTFTKITTGSIVNDGGNSIACAWGDYDGDGWLDLFVTNADGQKSFLYHNNRDGSFERIAVGPVVNDIKDWRGCAWADYDNDGNLDLLVTSVDENAAQAILYRNSGNSTFTRMPDTTIAGIVRSDAGYSEQPAWADYDNDGFLDLFVARNGPTGGADWLFRNDKNGGFVRITNGLAGTATEENYGATWADYNNDGPPDLFVVVSSDPAGNRLYLNRGDGSFVKITTGSIVTDKSHAYGCAWGDYDNDGNLDLFVANGFGGAENNALYHNNGNGTFTRMTSDIVGSIVNDGGNSASCAWGDYDNDGYLDLYVTNAGLDAQGNFIGQKNFLYHNNGDGSFARILTGSLVNDVADSLGCAWGDYDNDGFLDLFVANGGHTSENNSLYRNDGNTNGWLKVKLVGTVSNRSAIGAKVRVKASIRGKTFWQLREVAAAGASQNPLETHFGLGDATNIDLVRIEWPSGIVQEFHDEAVRQSLTITEPPRLLLSMATDVAQFSVKGGRGFQYQIEASTNLRAWSPISALTITNLRCTAQFVDTNSPGWERRFYRAVLR